MSNDMHPDLKWLAENVSEWCTPDDKDSIRRDGSCMWAYTNSEHCPCEHFSKTQWLQARQDLGLIMSDAEAELPAKEWAGSISAGEEEAEVLQEMVAGTVRFSLKQLRYQDAKGEDWIDEFARTASVDEFRGAMKFTIGKYNRRAGKKDELIKEIEKMRDYCDRWIEYEQTL